MIDQTIADIVKNRARLLTPIQAARRLGISTRTLQRRVASGEIVFEEVFGRLRRFDPEEINRHRITKCSTRKDNRDKRDNSDTM